MTILKTDKLSVCYGKKKALENVTFSLKKGSFTAVIGRNGSGKSTLLSALCGYLKYGGSACVMGRELKEIPGASRAEFLSYLPQSPTAAHITVEELLSMARDVTSKGSLSHRPSETSEIIENAIKKARLGDLRHKYLDRISGGELRRAYVGMILSLDSEIFLLDEATANLDIDSGAEILSIMKKECERGKTVILVTHDLSSAVKYADNVLVIDGGRQIFFGCVNEALDTEIIEKTLRVKSFSVDSQTFFAPIAD